MEQAHGLAHVASTKIKVGPKNDLFMKIKDLFSGDCDDVASFEVIMHGKKRRNLKHVFKEMSNHASGEDLKKMTVRAKTHVDEALADYYVEADGKFSEDIGTGTEKAITRRVAARFTQQKRLPELLTKIMDTAYYEKMDLSDLDTLGDVCVWRTLLDADDSDSAG